jgi:hypothetical protein
MKQIIYEFSNTVKYKKITHDHIIYLINKILIPRLEYVGQTHFLDERTANNLFRPIKRLFKNTLRLPNSIHDNIIFNNIFPSINSLWLNQISSQFSFVHNIFNSPQFNTIAIQKILETQYDFWLPNFPSSSSQINSHTPSSKTHLTKLILFFNKFHIHFHPILNTTISGGNTPILDYIQNPSSATTTSLKNKRIIFMDQLTSLDGSYLLSFDEIKKINSSKYKGPIPKWFKNLEDHSTLTAHNRRLLNPLNKPSIQPIHHVIPKISVKNQYYRPKNQWTVFWNPELSIPIYSKTIEQVNNHDSLSITYSTHYVPHIHHTENNNNFTPQKRTAILQPCEGCNLYTPYYRNLRPKCVIMNTTHSLHTFKIFPKPIILVTYDYQENTNLFFLTNPF